MDVQLKRGMLEVCVLSVLAKGASYGYALVRDISSCIAISESTLYPILKRLEASHMLTVYSVEHNGRLRKYYRITDLGKQKIDSFISEWKDVTDIYNFIINNKTEAQNG